MKPTLNLPTSMCSQPTLQPLVQQIQVSRLHSGCRRCRLPSVSPWMYYVAIAAHHFLLLSTLKALDRNVPAIEFPLDPQSESLKFL